MKHKAILSVSVTVTYVCNGSSEHPECFSGQALGQARLSEF